MYTDRLAFSLVHLFSRLSRNFRLILFDGWLKSSSLELVSFDYFYDGDTVKTHFNKVLWKL